MKLHFKKILSEPFSELIVYSSLNPIPVTLKFEALNILPETIYARNLAGENFIEFRFNKQTKKLYEITIIAIQEDTIELKNYDTIYFNEFYECYVEEESILDMSQSIKILRSEKSLSFAWGEQASKVYNITKNCLFGIDTSGNLCSIYLVDLSKETICEIIGF